MTEEKIRKKVMEEFDSTLKNFQKVKTFEHALMFAGSAITLNRMMRKFGWISGEEFLKNGENINSIFNHGHIVGEETE